MTDHYPIEVETDIFDDIGGVVGPYEKTQMQIRCGCTHDLGLDWGHHEQNRRETLTSDS